MRDNDEFIDLPFVIYIVLAIVLACAATLFYIFVFFDAANPFSYGFFFTFVLHAAGQIMLWLAYRRYRRRKSRSHRAIESGNS